LANVCWHLHLISLKVNERWHCEAGMAERRETHSRSERTRRRILKAARKRFSAEGYEGTTIRAVAADAAIDPSMVMRYFGSKEGLFAAAASFALALPDLAAAPHRTRGLRLAEHYLHLWEREEAGGGLAILLRAAATNEGAAQRVREIFRRQVLPAITAVAPDAPSTRAGLIASQLLGMAYCRYVVKVPALTTLGEDVIVANLGRTIQRYLDGPVGAAELS
jgi:AcrR family transcriptional regulator